MLSVKAQLDRDQFPLNREFKNGFFYLAPALTYTLPYSEGSFSNQQFDTTYTFISSPQAGSISYAFEIGWYHSFEKPRFFHYLEGGLAYRKFNGNSEFEFRKEWDAEKFSQFSNDSYQIEQLTAVIRIIRSQQLGKFTFLTYGPGINFDYHLNDNRDGSPFVGGDVGRQSYKAQLHLQLGVGFRLTEKLIFQPQIELPLLELLPMGDWHPVNQYVEGEHYPFLLSFRFMFLRKDLMNCNAPTLN